MRGMRVLADSGAVIAISLASRSQTARRPRIRSKAVGVGRVSWPENQRKRHVLTAYRYKFENRTAIQAKGVDVFCGHSPMIFADRTGGAINSHFMRARRHGR